MAVRRLAANQPESFAFSAETLKQAQWWIDGIIACFAELTAEAYPTTPQETAAMFDAEDKMVVPLIKKLQIKPE